MKIFDQLLDQYATAETAHLAANLRASYRMAADMYCQDDDHSAFALIEESEAKILEFVARARL